MLLKKPMVVSYKMAALTTYIMRRMLKQPFVSLPNLLAGKELVPEILHEKAIPESLAEAALKYLQDKTLSEKLQSEFLALHHLLRLNADEVAAKSITQLMQRS